MKIFTDEKLMKEIEGIVKYVYECGFEEGEHLAMAQSREPKDEKLYKQFKEDWIREHSIRLCGRAYATLKES